MNIGMDARPLQGETRFRGIGKSFEYFLKAMLQYHGTQHTYVFYVDKGLPLPELIQIFPRHRIIGVPTSLVGRRRYFRSFMHSYRSAVPRKKDVDVFFQYDASLGVPTSVPTVTVFHDLIPLLFRDESKTNNASGLRKYKNKLAGSVYWRKYKSVLRRYKRSAKIVAISRASKKDYLQHIGDFPAKDIVVVYHGFGAQQNAPKPSAQVKALASKPYIMYLGGIDYRKNIAELVRAFYYVKPDFPKLRLIAVGKEFELKSQLDDVGWNQEVAKNKTYVQDVVTPGFLDSDDMAYLYAHAQAFVHPTRYEGFGLPLLEAMQAGCPLICYDNSSIPELVGKAALVVATGQPLGPHVKKVLSDAKLRAKLAKAGPKQAASFSWERTVDETLRVLQAAARKK